MKIHHLINDIRLQNGGAQRIVRQLHGGLLAQNVESYMVALCHEADGPAAISLGNTSPYACTSFFSVLNYFRQYCSDTDIVHAHLFPTMLYVALAARLLNWSGQLVCTEHNTSNRRRAHFLGKLIDQSSYVAYKKIYCISQGAHDALQSWMPAQQETFKVVENGAVLPYQSFPKRSPKDKLVLASAGRLHVQKNYEIALRAISLLKDIELEYRIAGQGPEEKALKALCENLGISEKVNFYGYVDDIFEFFSQADIFLMPSRWEGFGLAVVEAMNAGLPVIASNVMGIRQILDTPVPSGILVAPDSPDEIAHAVRNLCSAEQRKTLGKSAFERSLDFSQDQMIKRYLEEYRKLSSEHTT